MSYAKKLGKAIEILIAGRLLTVKPNNPVYTALIEAKQMRNKSTGSIIKTSSAVYLSPAKARIYKIK